MSNATYIAITGGTIDSFYDSQQPAPHFVPQDGQTAVPEALKHLGIADQCTCHQYGNFDSKYIDNTFIDKVLSDVMEKGYKQVILTMGTDTMPKAARYAKQKLHRYGKAADDVSVVFTGAMYPLRDAQKQLYTQSDGITHLRAAYETISSGKATGVHIVMTPKGQETPQLMDPDFTQKIVETDGKTGASGTEARVIDSGFTYDEAAAHAAAGKYPPHL